VPAIEAGRQDWRQWFTHFALLPVDAGDIELRSFL
jgi:hypothetical protein